MASIGTVWNVVATVSYSESCYKGYKAYRRPDTKVTVCDLPGTHCVSVSCRSSSSNAIPPALTPYETDIAAMHAHLACHGEV